MTEYWKIKGKIASNLYPIWSIKGQEKARKQNRLFVCCGSY